MNEFSEKRKSVKNIFFTLQSRRKNPWNRKSEKNINKGIKKRNPASKRGYKRRSENVNISNGTHFHQTYLLQHDFYFHRPCIKLKWRDSSLTKIFFVYCFLFSIFKKHKKNFLCCLAVYNFSKVFLLFVFCYLTHRLVFFCWRMNSFDGISLIKFFSS